MEPLSPRPTFVTLELPEESEAVSSDFFSLSAAVSSVFTVSELLSEEDVVSAFLAFSSTRALTVSRLVFPSLSSPLLDWNSLIA